MAIFYYKDFVEEFGSSNFGDDINPFLISRLFSPSILESENLCLVGIGTLLNDKNVSAISDFKKKVVFSTGVGYGDISAVFDDSWEFVCVRGPYSSKKLHLTEDKAIADGAILLSDFYSVIPESKRDSSAILVPHIKTHWSSGNVLHRVCEAIGLKYLPPDIPYECFIKEVSKSKVVITEAMHGAILADTMRVPWIPVVFHEHLSFKWLDWFSSMGLDYSVNYVVPKLWNPRTDSFRSVLKRPYQATKEVFFKKKLNKIIKNVDPILSSESVISDRKSKLYEKVYYINNKFG